MAEAAFSGSGVKSVYHTYLSDGSKMQLNPSAATAEIIDHFTMYVFG